MWVHWIRKRILIDCFEPLPISNLQAGSWHCVLGKDSWPLQCCSPPRSIQKGNHKLLGKQTIRETCNGLLSYPVTCYRKQDRLQQSGPLGLSADIAFFDPSQNLLILSKHIISFSFRYVYWLTKGWEFM